MLHLPLAPPARRRTPQRARNVFMVQTAVGARPFSKASRERLGCVDRVCLGKNLFPGRSSDLPLYPGCSGVGPSRHTDLSPSLPLHPGCSEVEPRRRSNAGSALSAFLSEADLIWHELSLNSSNPTSRKTTLMMFVVTDFRCDYFGYLLYAPLCSFRVCLGKNLCPGLSPCLPLHSSCREVGPRRR